MWHVAENDMSINDTILCFLFKIWILNKKRMLIYISWTDVFAIS